MVFNKPNKTPSLPKGDNNNSLENRFFLAFDYGTRNIGVAVGQKVTRSATVLAPVRANKGVPSWIQIDDLIKEWQPQALVVGIPSSSDGGDLPRITMLAKGFLQELQKRYVVPTYAADEHLTTKAARAALYDRGGYKALEKESIDSLAAKIILEAWLRLI